MARPGDRVGLPAAAGSAVTPLCWRRPLVQGALSGEGRLHARCSGGFWGGGGFLAWNKTGLGSSCCPVRVQPRGRCGELASEPLLLGLCKEGLGLCRKLGGGR